MLTINDVTRRSSRLAYLIGLLVVAIAGCGDLTGGVGGTGGGGTGGGGTGGSGTGGGGTGGGETGGTGCETMTLFATIIDRETRELLDGVEVCETDTDNCAFTNVEGKVTIELPACQEVGYTFEKVGYVSGLWLDETDDAFFTGSFPMQSEATLEEFFELLMLPYPPTGGGIGLLAAPRRAGVTYELVDETARAYYRDEAGIPDPDLTATTSVGTGFFFDVPPGEYQAEYGGNATDCVPREAWPGDAANRTRVPVKAGFITYAGMSCSTVP